MTTAIRSRWPGSATARVLSNDLARFQPGVPCPRREFTSTTQRRNDDKDGGKVPIRRPQTPARAPPDPGSSSSSSIGISTGSGIRDQRPKYNTTDATDPPLRITRHVQDFGPPTGPRRSSPSTGTPLPRGPRLELSPEVRARIEANRKARGSMAAKAGGMLRTVGRGAGGRPRQGGPDPRRRRRPRPGLEDLGAGDEEDSVKGPLARFLPPDSPPRKTFDHEPEHLSLDDLRVDWPIVPTGQIGMVETISSKLRWMARRMQHGYDTPQVLALRMHRGEMVHFESETEKTEVVRLARELAEQRAARLTDRKTEVVPVRDASFQAVGEADRIALSDDLIKGLYSVPAAAPAAVTDEDGGGKGKTSKKQTSAAFLTEVEKALVNNNTYKPRERDQLVATIRQVLDRSSPPLQAASRANGAA